MQNSLASTKKIEVFAALAVVVLAALIGVAVSLDQPLLVLLILGGVLGGIVLILVYQRPAIGAAIVLGLAPLEGVLIYRGQSAVKIVTILCATIFILQVLITKKNIVLDSTVTLIMILIGWAFITILWSPNQYSSISNWISFALQGVLYFLLINFILSKNDLKIALWGHVLGGLILSIAVTNEIIARDFLRSEDVLGLGINLVSRIIGINLLLSLLLYHLETRFLARMILLTSIGIAGMGVVVALSRGTWLGITVSLSLLGMAFLFSNRFKIPFGQTLVWGIGVIAIYYVLTNYLMDEHALLKINNRFQSGLRLSDSAGGRFEIWQIGWQMFIDAPIRGHGFGSFSQEFSYYLESSGLAGSFHVGETKTAHNAYILLSSELGLIGVVLFLAILVSIFSKATHFLKNKQIKALAFFLSIFVFLLVATSVDSAINRKYLWYTLSLLTLLAQHWGQGHIAKSEFVRMDENK